LLTAIGSCGENLLLNFALNGVDGCYGFGERTKRLNKLGDSADCLTVDVVAVFRHTYARDDYDPTYVAIPFAILKSGERFLGCFSTTPAARFWTPARVSRRILVSVPRRQYRSLRSRWADVAGVTRRYAALTGRAPLPPLWALGYHQCRWGYRREAEFRELAAQFAAADVPVSALWYDIDYMDEYRLFTWDRVDFPDPAALNRDLKGAGIRAVTIVDPGVKREPGYAVYDSGREREVLPDRQRARVCRQGLAGRHGVSRFHPGDDPRLVGRLGWRIFCATVRWTAVWLDMNDPATGYSRTEEMRFDHGAIPHDRYHNQYAHFMSIASRSACDQVDPEGRPFLLTRSACAGTQRYSAVWTGDNASNWKHLRMALPCSLNLSLSGVAFNGPDVGGFMDDTNAELLVRWHQAVACSRSSATIPSAIPGPRNRGNSGRNPLAAIRGAIRTRYRLLPYLYQCFFAHWRRWRSGDASAAVSLFRAGIR
jgi:alpha-glucosidase